MSNDPSKEFSYEEVKKILCKYCEMGTNCVRKESGWYHPTMSGPLVLCYANDWRNKTCATIREVEVKVDENRYAQKCRIVFKKPMAKLNYMVEAEMHRWSSNHVERYNDEDEGLLQFLVTVCIAEDGDQIVRKYKLDDIASVTVTHEK